MTSLLILTLVTWPRWSLHGFPTTHTFTPPPNSIQFGRKSLWAAWARMHACSVPLAVSNPLRPYGLYPTKAPLSMGFSRQEYWSGLPCPLPGNLPNSGTEPRFLMSPALARRFFTTITSWEAPSLSLISGISLPLLEGGAPLQIIWNSPTWEICLFSPICLFSNLYQ